MSAAFLRPLLLALSTCVLMFPVLSAEAQRRSTAAPQINSATRLNSLYAEYWDALMRLDPLQATLQGDSRYNDQLPNTLSPAFRQQYRDFNRQWLARAEAIGDVGLQGQELLSYQLFVRDLRAALDSHDHPGWMLPVNAYYSPATLMAVLGSGTGAQPFNTVRDYENWSKRSIGIPTLFQQAIDNMRQGMAAGVVQPRALMESVLPQLDAILADGKPENTLFWAPIRTLPADFSDTDRERITAEYRRMISNRLLPAYRALRGFIATEYLPATRDTDGLSALPGGSAWYAHNIAQATTLRRDPAELHRLAMEEVTRLQTAIAEEMKAQRIRGKRSQLVRQFTDSKQLLPKDSTALLSAYQQEQARLAALITPLMPQSLPLAPLELALVDAHRAATSSDVSYQPPQGTGQAGTVWINPSPQHQHTRTAMTRQLLHEGLPGHHLQLGQPSTTALPRFRRHTGDTAFVEGWGLYAENLGNELTLYATPLQQLEWLHTQLLRAARVVADTGLHSQGWSRKQAADYLIDNADLPAAQATQEVERMQAMPAQMLAPGIGAWHLAQLREHSQQTLGERFSLPAFHEEVVRDGSLPLDILETKLQRWLDTQTSTAP